ncbi:hypothetical protein BpHYR1_006231 [Brachionus plicatilis]|uniref:Uncharacterized protein n=1 Tax=Brachionus plicatilis TaxID=10195 RepID=A0A3M7S8M1_BRAPC|nr:hypothetical protein BpHYR1_006231 [Brachionus plicatilis]
MSTPDKQKSANPSQQKKQKSTTPRKNSTSKNTSNAQVSSMQGMQAGMPMQQAKMAPQAQQYVPNQVMTGQGFPSNQQVIPRPMSQNPGAIMQPNMAQRMANPPNQSNQYYQAQGQQNPAQFQQQRIPQPGQVAAAGPMPQGANRMPYQPINQVQNPIRKPMAPNQPMPGYQAQMNQTRPMLPQGQPASVPGQQYQNNAQMYNQVNKQQTSIPAPRTVTPDPLAKQNTPSGSQNFMNPQQAVRFPNQQTAQLQHQKQAQQQRLFNTSTPPSNMRFFN